MLAIFYHDRGLEFDNLLEYEKALTWDVCDNQKPIERHLRLDSKLQCFCGIGGLEMVNGDEALTIPKCLYCQLAHEAIVQDFAEGGLAIIPPPEGAEPTFTISVHRGEVYKDRVLDRMIALDDTRYEDLLNAIFNNVPLSRHEVSAMIIDANDKPNIRVIGFDVMHPDVQFVKDVKVIR